MFSCILHVQLTYLYVNSGHWNTLGHSAVHRIWTLVVIVNGGMLKHGLSMFCWFDNWFFVDRIHLFHWFGDFVQWNLKIKGNLINKLKCHK